MNTFKDVAKSKGTNALLWVAVVLVISGFVWTYYNSSHGNFQHPVGQWIVVILTSVGFLFGSWWMGEWAKGEDGRKVAIRYVPMLLVFFVVVGVVGGLAKTNRDTGIPTEAQIDSNGNIKNPDAYIGFHKKVEKGSNKIFFDGPTEVYIRSNNRLPSWVVIDGYTQDPVGWIKAHPNASEQTKNEVMTTRRVK